MKDNAIWKFMKFDSIEKFTEDVAILKNHEKWCKGKFYEVDPIKVEIWIEWEIGPAWRVGKLRVKLSKFTERSAL